MDNFQYSEYLLNNIKLMTYSIEKLLFSCKRNTSDGIYRYFYQSYKVYNLQNYTLDIYNKLYELDPKPEKCLCEYYENIVFKGTGKEFKLEHNREWEIQTYPIISAFLISKNILEYCKKSAELEKSPTILPSEWAAVLCVYNIR